MRSMRESLKFSAPTISFSNSLSVLSMRHSIGVGTGHEAFRVLTVRADRHRRLICLEPHFTQHTMFHKGDDPGRGVHLPLGGYLVHPIEQPVVGDVCPDKYGGFHGKAESVLKSMPKRPIRQGGSGHQHST